MSRAAPPAPDFLDLSRRLLDVLGADGLGSESDQRQFAVDGIEPAWVAMPQNAAEAAQVLRLCAEHDLAVVPAGLGWRLGQGARPERVDVVLSTARMGAVVEHAAADLTLTVEAGASLAQVDALLRERGQCLPFDPASPAQTTVGGLIAARACGPSRQAFGTPRERLIGVQALLADGTRVKSGGRVVKNVAGYDLQKLLVGSFGTLAVIVEASFKLQPRPETTRTVSSSTGSIETLLRSAARLADSPLAPRFVELLLPADSSPLLVAGFDGAPEEVEEAVTRARALGVPEEGPALGEADLAARLEDLERPGERVVVMRAGLRRDALAPWLARSLARCRRGAERVHARAHAGVGVTRLRLEGAEPSDLASLVAEVRQEARRAGGYLVVESVPSSWKASVDVWGPPGADFALNRAVKAAFDPERRLSPGRYVGGL